MRSRNERPGANGLIRNDCPGLEYRSLRSVVRAGTIHPPCSHGVPHGQRAGRLCPFVDGQPLGIVEAKKVTLGPQNVLTQAERYSKGVEDSPFNFRGFRVPLLYSTNGEVFWFHDIRAPPEHFRRVAAFHTPEALTEVLSRDLDEACTWFAENTNEHERLRPYQIEANAAIEDAIANRKRQMLVAMATGTGKTFTMVNEVYRLMKSGVGQRILFLVDRRALAAQAVRAFASFEPEPSLKFDKIYEVYSQRFQSSDLETSEQFDPKFCQTPTHEPPAETRFVYVCTIQRMAINLFGRQAVWSGEEGGIDEDADQLKIPIHAFDVIIPTNATGATRRPRCRSGGIRSTISTPSRSALLPRRRPTPRRIFATWCSATNTPAPSGRGIWSITT